MSLTREIDQLYQAPLSTFIAERNALAKRAGRESARIKALEKPSASAWAVNQIYWRERRAYDTLVRAATRARTAHAQAIAGKKADVETLDRQHDAAVRAAVEVARHMLRQAGDAATGATMTAVVETLRSLPVDGEPGRLTRPVQVVGFAAFGDMLRTAASTPRAAADVLRFASAPKTKTPTADKREADRLRREREAAEARATAIRSRQRAAEAALARAKQRLAAIERGRRDLREKLEAADTAIDKARAEITTLEANVHAITREALD